MAALNPAREGQTLIFTLKGEASRSAALFLQRTHGITLDITSDGRRTLNMLSGGTSVETPLLIQARLRAEPPSWTSFAMALDGGVVAIEILE